ncbi:DNA polymerase III subunit delta [bacterium]|nr:DNA polymerase III subunit delta [bacterium]
MTDRVFWVSGSDSVRVSDQVRQLEREVAGASIERMEGADVPAVFEAISTVSLLCEPKVVVVRDPSFITGGAGDSAQADAVNVLLRSVPPDHRLILVSSKKVDQRLKIPTLIKKNSRFFEFNVLEDWDLPKAREWMVTQLKGLEKPISQAAMDAFIDHFGVLIGAAKQALATLSVYVADKNRIELEDVLTVLGSKAGNLYRLGEAVKGRRRDILVREINALREDDEEPIRILITIASTLETLLTVRQMVAARMSFDEIGNRVSRHKYFVERLHKDASAGHTVARLANDLRFLHQLDLGVKSGVFSGDSAMAMIQGQLFSDS